MNRSTSLPFECLRHVFEYIEDTSDLTQCQLTCRQWYQPATVRLYKSIKVNSNQSRTNSLIRTLTDTPALGQLIKQLEPSWKSSILPFLPLCPKLRHIQSPHPDKELYKDLIYAKQQSTHLRLLQFIPHPNGFPNCFNVYVNTALICKDTLEKLEVCDELLKNGTRQSHECDLLSGRLREFLNLKELSIVYHNNECDSLLRYDSTIDNFPTLKALCITIYPLGSLINTTHPDSEETAADPASIELISVESRPDIKALEVFGKKPTLNNDDSVKYIKRKFPKLNRLYMVLSSDHDSQSPSIEITGNVMKEFVKYMSNIPLLDIKLPFRNEDDIDAWINSYFHKNIGISYGTARDNSNTITFSQQYVSPQSLSLIFCLNPPKHGPKRLVQPH